MNNFWTLENLGQIHVELTNNCNAACPMCQRFIQGSRLLRPDFQISQISLNDFTNWIPENILKKLNMVYFCGTQGDPCVARDFYEICEYIGSIKNPPAVRVHTNGGMKTPEWWYKLGKLFSNHIDTPLKFWTMTFSIDGLEDTNHIYRRNVNWTNLIENVKSFIDGCGKNKGTYWDFLIFRHNEHQIEQARELSKDLGFELFVPKKSLGVDNGKQLVAMQALDIEGKFEYFIEPPINGENRNLAKPINDEVLYQKYEFKLEDYKSWKKQKLKLKSNLNLDLASFDKPVPYKIKCKSDLFYPKDKKEIFIDSFGSVGPCCYIGTHINNAEGNPKIRQLHNALESIGREKFSLKNFSLEDILNSGVLDQVYANSWKIQKVSEGRMAYCEETCGENSSIDRIHQHKDNPKNKIFYIKAE